jgi:hypothetical protein
MTVEPEKTVHAEADDDELLTKRVMEMVAYYRTEDGHFIKIDAESLARVEALKLKCPFLVQVYGGRVIRVEGELFEYVVKEMFL